MGSGAAGRTGLGPPSRHRHRPRSSTPFRSERDPPAPREFAEAWKTHPKCLQEPEDIAQVKEWIEEFVARQSEQAYAHLVMGLFLAQSGQSEQSIAAYKESAKLAPQSAYPHYFLAQIHERANHLEMAIKEYREAVRLDPSYAPARTNLGVAYQEQGRLEMAIPQYREVIKLNRRTTATAHANLACALAEQGKMEPALQSYKEALRLNPKDAAVHFALGGLYETRGRLDLAQKEYDAALIADPNFGPAHSAIGWLALGKQHMQDAIRSLQSSPQVQRARPSGLPRHRRILFPKGKRESALDNFAKSAQVLQRSRKKNAILNQLFQRRPDSGLRRGGLVGPRCSRNPHDEAVVVSTCAGGDRAKPPLKSVATSELGRNIVAREVLAHDPTPSLCHRNKSRSAEFPQDRRNKSW